VAIAVSPLFLRNAPMCSSWESFPNFINITVQSWPKTLTGSERRHEWECLGPGVRCIHPRPDERGAEPKDAHRCPEWVPPLDEQVDARDQGNPELEDRATCRGQDSISERHEGGVAGFVETEVYAVEDRGVHGVRHIGSQYPQKEQ
jgi:hypothetical protein